MILDLYSGGEAALKCRILRECGDRPLAAAVVSGVLLSQGLHELEALPDNYFKEASDFAVHLVKSDSMFRELLVQTLHIKYMVHSHDGDQSATQEVLDNP